MASSDIYTKQTVLPGYFRPTKNWDLIVIVEGELLASLEFKFQVGSFGNNFNNRTEEAMGSALDILTAYRYGAFRPSQKPWLGWLMLLEDTPQSKREIKVRRSHFDTFPEFEKSSYFRRYELFCERLMREQLYDSACLILSQPDTGNGLYSEPNEELSFSRFAASLTAKIMAFVES